MSVKKSPAWPLLIAAVAIVVGAFYYMSQSGTAPSIYSGLVVGDNATTTGSPVASSTTSTKKPSSAAPASTARRSSTVVAVAMSLPNTSQFNALFKSTGVSTQLTGKGPYTIFVPINSAFGQLPPGMVVQMTDVQKLRFIQYHIIAGRAIDPSAQTAGTIQALSGDALNFSYGPDKIPLVGSAIFLKKYEASNGVVYTIDNVLLPPQRL